LDGKDIIVESLEENRSVIVDCIFDKGTIDPSADGNWSFAHIGKPVTLLFESSPVAEKYLSAAPGVTVLGPGQNGLCAMALG